MKTEVDDAIIETKAQEYKDKIEEIINPPTPLSFKIFVGILIVVIILCGIFGK